MADIPSLRSTWSQGGTALGAWISTREPLLAEVAATSGFDYVSIDMQHGLADLEAAVTMLHAMARTPAVPVVRVPSNDPAMIGRVLDAGALGVIIPMVNTVEEAQRAVAACRYAPAGSRSFGPVGTMARYGLEYLAHADELVACIPMIETREAVDAIDDILAVPGIDAVYVGPADLSITLGLPPGLDNADERFTAAITRVLDACARHDVVPGIHANADLVATRHAAGFRLITCSTDLQGAMQGLRNDVLASRRALDAS